MLKKMVILSVLGFIAVAAFSGTKVASYIRSEVRSARQHAEDSIPPEKEIARLRSEVGQLDKDSKALVHQLAKKRVEVNQLKDDVDGLATKQSAEKARLLARAEIIDKAEGQVTLDNRPMSVEAAKVKLEAEVKTYKSAQKKLEATQARLDSFIKQRDALEKQFETMQTLKTELSAAIDEKEAELTVLNLHQMESKYQTDDTRVAKIKEDLRKLGTKLDVQREELKLTQKVSEEPAPSVSGKSAGDIVAPLNNPAPAKKPEGAKPDAKSIVNGD
jgi:chromosome segregation ATPase